MISTRRAFVVLSVLGLLALALFAAACGGGEEEAPTETPGAGESPAAGETPSGGELTFEVKMIPTIQFDKSELSIPANQDVTATADNTDEGILHNFAVYNSRDEAEGGGEAIAATEGCTAPCTGSATLNLPPAEYFFRCDFHPQQMTGTLVVK